MLSFVTKILEASSAKLACSVDDVIWLSAFLTPNFPRDERIKNALVYIAICLSQPLIALFISTCGEAALDTLIQKVFGDVKFSTDKFLTIMGGFILCCYAIFLGIQFAREHLTHPDYYDPCKSEEEKNIGGYDVIKVKAKDTFDLDTDFTDGEDDQENDDSDHCLGLILQPANVKTEEEDEEKKIEPSDHDSVKEDGSILRDRRKLHPLEIAINNDNDSEIDSEDSSDHNDHADSKSLIFIAFFGSLDGLTLYVPLLAGHILGIFQLIIGVAISVSFIVTVAFCITKCQIVSDVIQRIPIFVIVSIFATMLLVRGILMP